jgi:HK97 gp10 family phage protein
LTVKGLSSLQRKLSALPDAVKEQISKAMEAGAQDIVDLAQRLVPIDEMVLYESIGWTWGNPPKGSISLGRSKRRPGDGLRITVYAGNDKAFYARWVEFGTNPHNVASGGGTKAGKRSLASGGGLGHPGSSAKPFFFPAYRANRKRVRARITRATNAAAKKFAVG